MIIVKCYKKWIDENPPNYQGILKNAQMDVTDQDFKKVIEMIKYLNDGENLEKYLDVEEIYEKDGAFSILPWDLNLSFEGFDKQEMRNK